MSEIDSAGIVLLIKALELACECEAGQRKSECAEHQLYRWWRAILVSDERLLAGRLAPDARRSA